MGRISTLRFMLSIFGSGVSLIRLLVNLFLIWLTLGWKVRKARKAFEKQLINQGMGKHDAKRIGAQYSALKHNIENMFKQSLVRWK